MTCFGTFLHQHFWTHLALEALAFLASLDQGCPILLFQPGVSEKSAAQTRICRAHTGRGTGCCFEGSDTYYLDSLPKHSQDSSNCHCSLALQLHTAGHLFACNFRDFGAMPSQKIFLSRGHRDRAIPTDPRLAPRASVTSAEHWDDSS